MCPLAQLAWALRPRSSTLTPPRSTAAGLASASWEGWMYKATKRGRWKRRFFILAPGPDPATSAWLTYYTGEGNRSARGFIPLGDVSSLACVGEGHKLLLFTPQRLWRLQPSDVAQSAGLLQALRPVVQAEASVLAQGWASKLPRSKFGRAVSVGNPWRRRYLTLLSNGALLSWRDDRLDALKSAFEVPAGSAVEPYPEIQGAPSPFLVRIVGHAGRPIVLAFERGRAPRERVASEGAHFKQWMSALEAVSAGRGQDRAVEASPTQTGREGGQDAAAEVPARPRRHRRRQGGREGGKDREVPQTSARQAAGEDDEAETGPAGVAAETSSDAGAAPTPTNRRAPRASRSHSVDVQTGSAVGLGAGVGPETPRPPPHAPQDTASGDTQGQPSPSPSRPVSEDLTERQRQRVLERRAQMSTQETLTADLLDLRLDIVAPIDAWAGGKSVTALLATLHEAFPERCGPGDFEVAEGAGTRRAVLRAIRCIHPDKWPGVTPARRLQAEHALVLIRQRSEADES